MTNEKMDYRTCSECGKKLKGKGFGNNKCRSCQSIMLRETAKNILRIERKNTY